MGQYQLHQPTIRSRQLQLDRLILKRFAQLEGCELVPTTDTPQDSFWQVTCESIAIPLARVGIDNRFIWVNDAFSRLVGYSISELTNGMTWVDITIQEDVGSDMLSIKEILDGKRLMYTMEKTYRGKHGDEVEVNLTVFRYPLHPHTDVICFIAHAMPRVAFQKDLEDVKTLAFQLRSRIENLMNEKEVPKAGTSTNTSGVNISIGNSDFNFPKWIVGVILALILAAMYLAYLGGWNFHQGEAKPPSLPNIEMNHEHDMVD